MPRKRKYDVGTNYPVTLFIKIPISLYNTLLEQGYTQFLIQKEIEGSKVVENYLMEFVEKNSKKD